MMAASITKRQTSRHNQVQGHVRYSWQNIKPESGQASRPNIQKIQETKGQVNTMTISSAKKTDYEKLTNGPYFSTVKL